MSHKSKVLILLLILGFFLRLSYLFEFRQTPFFNASLLSGFDQHTWDDMGFKSLAHPWFVDGQPFYQAPGYAYFLSLVYLFFGAHNYLAVGIIQILLDLLTAFLLFLIGRRLWNDWVGISACGIYVFYRPFIYYSATILSDSFILFTSVLCLFLVYWVLEEPRRPRPGTPASCIQGQAYWGRLRRWFLAGLGFGLAAITKPTILLFLFFAFLAFVLSKSYDGDPNVRLGKGPRIPAHPPSVIPACFRRESNRFPLRTGFLRVPYHQGRENLSFLPVFFAFVLGFLLLVLPIAIRNSLLAGKFVTIATYGSVNWKIGNSADSLGLFMYPKGPLLSPDSFAFWKILGKKTFFFFSSYEWPQNLNIYLLTAITHTLNLPLFAFGLVVPLGLVGLFVNWDRRRCYLHLYTLANVLSIIAFFITSRYRLPAVAGFILLACGYLYFLVEKVAKLRTPAETKSSIPHVVIPVCSKQESIGFPLTPCGNDKQYLSPAKDLAAILISLFFVTIFSFVLVNSWSGDRIGAVHAKNYVLLTTKNIDYDLRAGRPDLAQKKADACRAFLMRYQSRQIR